MRITIISLLGVLALLFCVSCATTHTIPSDYVWHPEAVTQTAKVDKRVSVVLNNEFKDYIYKRQAGLASYTFSYGKILSYNVPEAFSSVFDNVDIVANLNEAQDMGCNLICVPKLSQAYTKVGIVGQDMPTRLLLEINILDHSGNLIDTISVRGESTGEISGGSTAVAYLIPGTAVKVFKQQFERSQNEAVDDLLSNLTQELWKAKQRY